MTRVWLGLLVLAVLLPVAAVALQLIRDAQAAVISFLPSYALFLAQIAYRYSEPVYFFVESWRLRLSGAGASWGARAEFERANIDAQLVDALAQEFRRDDSQSRVLAREPLSEVIAVHGLTVRVSGHAAARTPGAEDERAVLVVEVVPSEWPFRKAVTLATTTVPALFERARTFISPESEKYSSELRFSSGNPYLGFYLRNLHLSHVDRFVAEMRVPVPGDPIGGIVTAQKEKLTIVARSISGLSALSRRYLTLARA